MKNLWKGINYQIISCKSSNNKNIPSKILIGESELSDTKSIANAFNDFFVNIGNNLVSTINSADSPISFMPQPQINSLFLESVTSNEIIIEIDGLNASKATGPFSIPISIFKTINESIAEPLAAIFNCSMLTGTTPDSFK